jgi:hypothetical protein
MNYINSIKDFDYLNEVAKLEKSLQQDKYFHIKYPFQEPDLVARRMLESDLKRWIRLTTNISE